MNMIFPLGNIYALPAMVSLDVKFSNDGNKKKHSYPNIHMTTKYCNT